LYACGGGKTGLGSLPRGIDAAKLNLVVVTLDTTRADRIGCYGAKDVATPHLDALAARGVRFDAAVSPMPLTLPAHATLFTSLLPGAHGVRDNGGYKLSPDTATLAEALHDRGFATGGFVSAFVLDHRWGIAQGFDRYFDDFDLKTQERLAMGEIQRPGNETVDTALAWLGDVKDKRFFAWIHLYDPHAPYEPPEPYRSRYAGRAYDGEIAWTDALVGRIVDEIERLDLSKRTVVLVLADHGESLGEHGEHGHGYYVYEQVAHIPAILASPHSGLHGRTVADVVRTIDFAPTLLELLGVTPALPAAQGVSLVPLLAEGKPPARDGYTESFYARFHYGWSELRAVRTKRWHFIEAPKAELYDLERDPGEKDNLAAKELATVDQLRESLAEFERESSPQVSATAPVEEDEETLRKLASLGYIGGSGDAVVGSWRNLPDPKDRFGVYERMNRIRALVKNEKEDEAIPLLQAVIAEAPEVIDAYYTLANCHYKRKEYAEAKRLYQKTLSMRPDHDYAMIGLADTLVAEGKIDDAISGYEHFLGQDPGNAQILYRLAQVQLDAGRDAGAKANFLKTLGAEPKTARAEVGLGVVAFRAKDEAGARAALARALAIDPKVRWARYNRALVEEAAGNVPGAIEDYRAEIGEHPDAYKALFNLGRLLAKTGDRAGAADAFRKAVAAQPDWGIGRFFLARTLLESGDFEGAKTEALRGLELDSKTEFAALGHYVLADVYERQGKRTQAASEVRKAQAIERR
jgi:arylsulfatase A-like enzyme/Tfp pilus assembly protein PilF